MLVTNSGNLVLLDFSLFSLFSDMSSGYSKLVSRVWMVPSSDFFSVLPSSLGGCSSDTVEDCL